MRVFIVLSVKYGWSTVVYVVVCVVVEKVCFQYLHA